MKEIPLTGEFVALVDDEDYERLMRWQWHALERRGIVYAVRSNRRIMMHRLIMGDGPAGAQVDHRDRNGLNNTRGNLRWATAADNMRNRRRQKNNTTGYIGVRRSDDRFQARIKVNGKFISLGGYGTAIEAAIARDAAAVVYHGEFASLNFPTKE